VVMKAVISIVDDEESVRVAIGSLVRSMGYQSYLFSCAEDFLSWSRFEETACLITDVQMPGMSGLDLQAQLIKLGYDIPVVFITAFPEESIRQRAMSAGAVEFLSKPFDVQTMIDCIEKHGRQ